MYLNGWKYEGRKISEQLHEQILLIIDIIKDPLIVGNKTWPALQPYIAKKLGIAPGQVRTIKRMMEEFGILKKGSLNAKEIPSIDAFTDSGLTLINLFQAEKLMIEQNAIQNRATLNEIKGIYKLYYQKVLANYCYINDNVKLHPLKATLKALDKYGYLDYWEWYILNTFIQSDDNSEEESKFDEIIKSYRNGTVHFSPEDIKENKLSHSYVLGNFEFAGLVKVDGSKYKLKITLNENEREIINSIIEKEG